MRHDEWLKRIKIRVLDAIGTGLQIGSFGYGIFKCIFVHPIFYIPILAISFIVASFIYHSIGAVIMDIQTEIWNNRFEETMNKMIKYRR